MPHPQIGNRLGQVMASDQERQNYQQQTKDLTCLSGQPLWGSASYEDKHEATSLLAKRPDGSHALALDRSFSLQPKRV